MVLHRKTLAVRWPDMAMVELFQIFAIIEAIEIISARTVIKAMKTRLHTLQVHKNGHSLKDKSLCNYSPIQKPTRKTDLHDVRDYFHDSMVQDPWDQHDTRTEFSFAEETNASGFLMNMHDSTEDEISQAPDADIDNIDEVLEHDSGRLT